MSETAVTPRGRLKLYLGYAAGVGKTYRMLEDAHRVLASGVDLVIGYIEPHGRPDTTARAKGLPDVPCRRVAYRGITLTEMDIERVLARAPAVCLVDELPHTNTPDARHGKRWEEVLELLDAGISVWTTMNIQHLESLNDQVAAITGVRVRETVPDWLVAQADDVVMVDLTPHSLLNRLRRGVIYPPDGVGRALDHFFKESTLVALRELALRQTAHEVETHHAGPDTQLPDGPQRLLLHLTADPATALVIRRGRRLADFLHADSFAVYVHPGAALSELPDIRRAAVERHLEFARRLHIETRVLYGPDPAAVLVEFARVHQVTQILLLRPRPSRWRRLAGHGLAARVIRRARDLQVIVVASRLVEDRGRDQLP
ncbi:MAG TPA: sensor histidine kinase KdpD [Vicinamibacterales bacterium]|jgi:two-component system sensor histidine kinase KdpD